MLLPSLAWGASPSVTVTVTSTISQTPTPTPTPSATFTPNQTVPIASATTTTLVPGVTGKQTTINVMKTNQVPVSGSITVLEGALGSGCASTPTILAVAGSGSSRFETEFYGLAADLGMDLCVTNSTVMTLNYNETQQ